MPVIGAVKDHYVVEKCLLRHPTGVSLADLARTTGMPKSVILNHLDTMRTYGRAEQSGTLWKPTAEWILMRFLAADDVMNA